MEIKIIRIQLKNNMTIFIYLQFILLYKLYIICSDDLKELFTVDGA